MSAHVVSTVVLVTHWTVILGLSVRVIMRRPPVGVSLAWLAVVFSVPFVGAGLYLFFGEKRISRARAARIAANLPAVQRWQAGLRAEHEVEDASVGAAAEPLRRHAERLLGFPALGGNGIELLEASDAVFDRLVADVDAARRTCHLSFYIWHEGGRTSDVVDALVRAAGRGVRCRALADALGSERFLAGAQAVRLREAGVDLRAALPTGLIRSLGARADLRNHRKIVVIDDRVAYTGSQNLVDPRFFKQTAGVGEWVDAMVRITGPTAASLDAVFRLDWTVETGHAFEAPPEEVLGSVPRDRALIQVVPSGPGLRPEAIHQILLGAIYAARHELVMTTPYFVPDEAMLTALLSAALRGVEVTLIVPAKNDSVMVRYASVAHFDDLLAAGARIARFRGGLLHTKSLTIDGETALFGSVNLDMRSQWLNFEITLLVYDAALTRRLRALQRSYLSDADVVDAVAWARRPRWHRFLENSFRLLGPLL